MICCRQSSDSRHPSAVFCRLSSAGRPAISGPNGLTSVLRPLSSVFCPLSSVLLLLAAVWAAQVMSSAWIRARGAQLFLKGAFGKAEKMFQTAARIDPQNWQADWGLGQVYYQARYYELDPVRKHEWAVKEQAAYAAAYRINHKKEEVIYGLGRVELFLGNRDRGLDLLREAANYKRFNDFYWRKLGIELRKAGLYDEALSAFESAQKLDRSNPTVKRNIQWLKKRQK
jgi:Flp pilus assembly protein TadD